jgi:hypothetical protein
MEAYGVDLHESWLLTLGFGRLPGAKRHFNVQKMRMPKVRWDWDISTLKKIKKIARPLESGLAMYYAPENLVRFRPS